MNLANVLIGILLVVFLFLPDKYIKDKIRNKSIKEFVHISKFMLVINIIFYTIIFTINILTKNDTSSANFLKESTHVVKSIQVINIFTFVSVVIIKKIFKIFYKSHNNKGFLFIIPIINILITLVYFLNQTTDYFLKFKLIKHIFKLFKLSDINKLAKLSKAITGVLMLENAVVIIYILFIYNNENDVEIMKHVCESANNKVSLNKKCANEILQDIFFYALFFKLVVAIVIIVTIFYIKNYEKVTSSNAPVIGYPVANTSVLGL